MKVAERVRYSTHCVDNMFLDLLMVVSVVEDAAWNDDGDRCYKGVFVMHHSKGVFVMHPQLCEHMKTVPLSRLDKQ